MKKTVYAPHIFNWFKNGHLHSRCDSDCCNTVQAVDRGDTVEKNFGSGVILKLEDGTLIRANKFEVVKYPTEFGGYYGNWDGDRGFNRCI